MDAQENDKTDDVRTLQARAHQERAADKLDRIIELVKQGLAENGIDVPLFFLVPNSGDAIVSFGTTGDPPEELWERIMGIVCAVVKEAVGVGRLGTRAVICAATDGSTSSASS